MAPVVNAGGEAVSFDPADEGRVGADPDPPRFEAAANPPGGYVWARSNETLELGARPRGGALVGVTRGGIPGDDPDPMLIDPGDCPGPFEGDCPWDDFWALIVVAAASVTA